MANRHFSRGERDQFSFSWNRGGLGFQEGISTLPEFSLLSRLEVGRTFIFLCPHDVWVWLKGGEVDVQKMEEDTHKNICIWVLMHQWIINRTPCSTCTELRSKFFGWQISKLFQIHASGHWRKGCYRIRFLKSIWLETREVELSSRGEE